MDPKTIIVLTAVIGMVGCFWLGFCAGVCFEISRNIKANLKNIGKGEKK